MKNQEIRNRIIKAGLKHWQVAEATGVSQYTLCVWLRTELTGERLKRVESVIDRLTKKDGGGNG